MAAALMAARAVDTAPSPRLQHRGAMVEAAAAVTVSGANNPPQEAEEEQEEQEETAGVAEAVVAVAMEVARTQDMAVVRVAVATGVARVEKTLDLDMAVEKVEATAVATMAKVVTRVREAQAAVEAGAKTAGEAPAAVAAATRKVAARGVRRLAEQVGDKEEMRKAVGVVEQRLQPRNNVRSKSNSKLISVSAKVWT